MIKITQLLKEISDSKNSNIASLHDEKEWKLTEIIHMEDMKFKRDGDSTYILDNPPMRVYKQKKGPFVFEEPSENHQDTNEENGTEAPVKHHGRSAFDKSKKVVQHTFTTFNELIEFFDKYQQDL